MIQNSSFTDQSFNYDVLGITKGSTFLHTINQQSQNGWYDMNLITLNTYCQIVEISRGVFIMLMNSIYIGHL